MPIKSRRFSASARTGFTVKKGRDSSPVLVRESASIDERIELPTAYECKQSISHHLHWEWK